MAAFVDLTCSKCRRRYGFAGELKDAPACPHCGTRPDAKALAADAAAIDELRKVLDDKSKAEWAARTPAQAEAYDAGRADYAAGMTLGDRLKRNPYNFDNTGDRSHPLRHWWARGWQNAWFEATEAAETE